MDMTEAMMFYSYLLQDFSFVIECSVEDCSGEVLKGGRLAFASMCFDIF